MSLLILTQDEVRACISMGQAIDVMASSFKEYYAGQANLPLRTHLSIPKEDALMLTMPAYLGGQNALGLKVVSVFPNNQKLDKATINGVILLLDEQTGEVKAMMEAGYLTAVRTGAVSGLATQYLATKEADHVAILGSGAQAYTQLEAVINVRPIKKISLWSRSMDNAKKFARQLNPHEYEINCCATVGEAVCDADVICTATSSTTPLIHCGDLKKGAHINAVGSHTPQMCEISSDVLHRGLVVVDQIEAATKEAGEIVSALQKQSITRDDLIELGALVSGCPFKKEYDYSVFKSVGLAIQDISIANTVYQNALKHKLGTTVSL